MRKLLTNWKAIAGVAIVAAMIAAAMWPESIEVDAVAVERKALQVTLDEEGETRVRERFVVSAPVAGRLQRIELEPGDRVVRGRTVLARLVPSAPPLLDARTQAELRAGIEGARAVAGQARAERERAAAALERARAQARRQQELVTAGAISREEFESTETVVRTAEEALNAASFGVNRAEFDLQMTQARLQPVAAPSAGSRPIEIVSPINGVVLKRVRESESVVQAGESLVEVGDPTRLEIVADLLSTDAVKVKPGARVLIDQWGGEAPLEGRVRRVEPSGFMKVSALGVEEQRVNVIIDVADPAAAKALGDGYRVEVQVVVWEEQDVLTVPVGALFRRDEAWAVFVASGDRVSQQVVDVGQRNARDAQILKGLEAGQQVVLHPPDTLSDGSRIKTRGEP